MPLKSVFISFTDLVIVHPTAKTEIHSLWCRRFLAECDGQTNAAEIAQKLRLPPKMVAKIVQKIIDEDWGRVEIEPQYSLLVKAMIKRLGQERTSEILGRASSMLRRSPDTAVEKLLSDGIIAIDFQLSEQEEGQLREILQRAKRQPAT